MKLITGLFLLLSTFCYSQIDSKWLLGYDSIAGTLTGRTILDFSTGSMQVNYASGIQLSFERVGVLITSNQGNVLFYSNGFAVCNSLNDTMPNGGGIDSSYDLQSFYPYGSPLTQGAFVIPDPGNSNRYYMFHETAEAHSIDTSTVWFFPSELRYSIIDMTLDSGRGDLAIREQFIITDTLTVGRITGVKHANGRDWWVVVFVAEGNLYYSVLVTPDGIQGPYQQHIGTGWLYNSLGHAVFSPDGSKYAEGDGQNDLQILDFDRCTGLFSNPVNISASDPAYARGVAFSLDSRYLYFSSGKFLYQYDMNAADIALSEVVVAEWDSFYAPSPPFATGFYTPQLAPDGKIYICTSSGTDKLHVINYPDSAGLACGVCQHCINLASYNAFTMPNNPNYSLGPVVGSICDSLVSDVAHFEDNADVHLYPNPVTDFFWLDYDLTRSTRNALLTIYNTLGQPVLHKTVYNYFKTTKVNCSTLSPGIYYLSIEQSGKHLASSKFIKN